MELVFEFTESQRAFLLHACPCPHVPLRAPSPWWATARRFDEPTVKGQDRFTVRGGAEVQRIGEVHAVLHAGERPGHQGRALDRDARQS